MQGSTESKRESEPERDQGREEGREGGREGGTLMMTSNFLFPERWGGGGETENREGWKLR